MRLKKPSKQNIGEQMFMLYNHECAISNYGCENTACQNNLVSTCGGTPKPDGLIKCTIGGTILKVFPCKK